ncbi:MAG: SDR family oxidoreductase [Actinomycetota bacterium]|nr:SDR family oxidoreductase [Actinomycetota bacterium]
MAARQMAARHDNTVALVTGAASGIGRSTAIMLAQEGATVVATDANADGLAAVAAEQSGITPVPGNLTDGAFIEALVAQAEAVGPVRVLANVAGVMDYFYPVSQVSDDLWDLVQNVNLKAPMRLCRLLVPLMAERGGAIVNVASIAGLGGSGAGAAYIASKHGIIGLTKHIAYTYGNTNVRCNAVCPGGTETNIATTATPPSDVMWAYLRQQPSIALGEKTAKPEQIASTISWLASAEASHVNGVVLPVDGGWKSA